MGKGLILKNARAPFDTNQRPRPVKTSGFGWRNLNYKSSFHGADDWDLHGGLICSILGGVVIDAFDGGIRAKRPTPATPVNRVIVDHGQGITSEYYHLNSNQNYGVLVNAGQKVKKGQILGFEGGTGYAFGDHLHFVLKINGQRVNPSLYIDYSKSGKLYLLNTDIMKLYKRLKQDRPDIFKVYPSNQAGALKWWLEHGTRELILKLGELGRREVYSAVGKGTITLEDWYITHAKKEYGNIWKAEPKSKDSDKLKNELQQAKKEAREAKEMLEAMTRAKLDQAAANEDIRIKLEEAQSKIADSLEKTQKELYFYGYDYATGAISKFADKALFDENGKLKSREEIEGFLSKSIRSLKKYDWKYLLFLLVTGSAAIISYFPASEWAEAGGVLGVIGTLSITGKLILDRVGDKISSTSDRNNDGIFNLDDTDYLKSFSNESGT